MGNMIPIYYRVMFELENYIFWLKNIFEIITYNNINEDNGFIFSNV